MGYLGNFLRPRLHIIPRSNKARSAPSSQAPIRARLDANKPLFDASRPSGRIPRFDPSEMPHMGIKASYEDDVAMGRYTVASRTCIGEQRRGISGDHHGASALLGLVSEALRPKFLLDQQIHLPLKTIKGFDFLQNC